MAQKLELLRKLSPAVKDVELKVAINRMNLQDLFQRKARGEMGGFFVSQGQDDWDHCMQTLRTSEELLKYGQDLLVSRYTAKRVQDYCKKVSDCLQQK